MVFFGLHAISSSSLHTQWTFYHSAKRNTRNTQHAFTFTFVHNRFENKECALVRCHYVIPTLPPVYAIWYIRTKMLRIAIRQRRRRRYSDHPHVMSPTHVHRKLGGGEARIFLVYTQDKRQSAGNPSLYRAVNACSSTLYNMRYSFAARFSLQILFESISSFRILVCASVFV